jgi:hypothetical protein
MVCSKARRQAGKLARWQAGRLAGRQLYVRDRRQGDKKVSKPSVENFFEFILVKIYQKNICFVLYFYIF